MKSSVRLLALTLALAPASAFAQAPAPTPTSTDRVEADRTPAPAAPVVRSQATRSDDWTGLYAGASAGFGFGSGNVSFAPLPNAASFIALAPTTLGVSPSGLNIGFHGGYNMQRGNLVFGVEGDYTLVFGSGYTELTPIPPFSGSSIDDSWLEAEIAPNWVASVRGRVGILRGDLLIYGTAGVAFGSADYYALTDYTTLFFGVEYVNEMSATSTGFIFGAGVEKPINDRLSWKVEWLMSDLGSQTQTVNASPFNGFQVRNDWTWKQQQARFGLNLRF